MQTQKTELAIFEIPSINFQHKIVEELEQETRQINETLEQIIELQKTLVDQITIFDQENLDNIEVHYDNTQKNITIANKYLDAASNNTTSYFNPFKNLKNIFSLSKLIFW